MPTGVVLVSQRRLAGATDPSPSYNTKPIFATYTSKNMRGFFNEIKLNKSAKVASKLKPCDFKDFDSGIMQTIPDVVFVDKFISNGVESYSSAHVNDHCRYRICW